VSILPSEAKYLLGAILPSVERDCTKPLVCLFCLLRQNIFWGLFCPQWNVTVWSGHMTSTMHKVACLD